MECCGQTFSNQSAAEIHRYQAHTPKGVLDHYKRVGQVLQLQRKLERARNSNNKTLAAFYEYKLGRN
jgi:hypothetical protein